MASYRLQCRRAAPTKPERIPIRQVKPLGATEPLREVKALPHAKSRRNRPSEDELLEQHLPLVRAVVGRLAMTLPDHVDADDLNSAGALGLLDAIRRYDPGCGTAFETYARIRIRGAVLDELRRQDWVPRSVHRKARLIQETLWELEQAKGRLPDETEMARALNLSLDEYHRWLDETRPTTFVCLDAVSDGESGDGPSAHESVPDADQPHPLETTARHELTERLTEQLERLPVRERQILTLYYFEGLRLREIAAVFGLTESRICQLHAQALHAIKALCEQAQLSLT
jgi:RNA polymerase sigma factor for flagellar operon FliA